MLYLVATPIGNLRDITLRALDVLREVDLILCEDTRRSNILLNHYEIKTPTQSYHKHSEKKQEEEILKKLAHNSSIALISDAGTPGINDPGSNLVAKCHENSLPVTNIPGPCSVISALILSGFPTSPFQFIGFLSKKNSQRKHQIIDALFYPGVTLFFESPKRVNNTLNEIASLAPSHRVAVIREITKIHESYVVAEAKEVCEEEFRGEIVLALEGHAKKNSDLEPKTHVQKLMDTYDLSKKEAIKLSAELQGISKKNVYSCFISDTNV